MTPAETLDLLGRSARTQLCGIVTKMLNGVPETTTEPSQLGLVFVGAGPELDALTWYDLLAAAAEAVTNGRMTIRRADQELFRTEVLGTARYVAVLPTENAPERVQAGHSVRSLYYSGSKLKFRREQPRTAN